MKLRTKEGMREYQKIRRLKLRGRYVEVKMPVKSLEELRALKQAAVPLGVRSPCVYFLFRGDTLIYVGQSQSLLGRISSHQHGSADSAKKDFDSIAVLEVLADELNEIELAYIKSYSPEFNKLGTPCNTVCMSCKDKETQIFILRGRVKKLEEELRLRPAAPKPDSPYRF